MSKFLNISTDNTLGGSSASDDTVSSQKAIKEYVDNHGGGGSADIDNLSITTNSSDELQAVGVINQNNTSTALKQWSGTRAQYDAIVSKDSNTLYNITDDTDVTLTVLEALYPVGSIYITTANTCPLASLISGSTWVLETSRVLVDKYVSGRDWWNLYSDGWCEQGGHAEATSAASTQQIALLKNYADTNYSAFITRTATSDNYLQVTITQQTVASFTTGYSCNKYWFACGYTSTTTNHKRFRRMA